MKIRKEILLLGIIVLFSFSASAQTYSWNAQQACTGVWRPAPHGNTSSGPRCEGEKLSADQVTARETIRLAQMVSNLLSSTSQKLTNIENKVEINTKAMQEMQKEMKLQNQTYNLELQKLITGRFANLPAELLNNPLIQGKLEELKKQIMEDVERIIPKEDKSDDTNKSTTK